MTITCMIVDDEPLARRVLEKYIDSLPSLKLVKECGNALEAAAFLHSNTVDLIFLDIKMPQLTGIDFLKTLRNPPRVIITTAFSEYAVEGYEYAVADYLLKPIAFDRFLKAVNRIITPSPAVPLACHTDDEHKESFMFIRVDNADQKICYSDISYIQGYGNYLKIFTGSKMLLASSTLSEMEERLPRSIFVRVHKSFIISLDKIDKLEGNMIRIGKQTIPVGKHYKMRLENIIKQHHI